MILGGSLPFASSSYQLLGDLSLALQPGQPGLLIHAVGAGAAGGLDEDPVAAGAVEGVDLELRLLVGGEDAGRGLGGGE
jgi:hypothetical protein